MDALKTISMLEGAAVVGHREHAWGPSGKLGLANLRVSGPNACFELLVPTDPNDIWDYIWTSEREQGTTDKVQLFQSNTPVPGSRITSIHREGQSDRWDEGPEQYRLAFVVPLESLRPDIPIEVRFYWADQLMSSALSIPRKR